VTAGYRHGEWWTEGKISLSALLLRADQYSARHHDHSINQTAVHVSFPRILRPLRLVAASLLALVSLTLLASAASAQETCPPQPYGGTVGVCGTSITPTTEAPATTEPTVLGTSQTRFGVTGGDMAGIAAIGGGAVAVGTALVLAARRRRMGELV
jgi:hypothetical protein